MKLYGLNLIILPVLVRALPHDTSDKGSGPILTRFVTHALDSECALDMLRSGMPAMSQLLAKRWGPKEVFRDAFQATLYLINEYLPAELISTLWSGVEPKFPPNEISKVLGKIQDMQGPLEDKLRFATVFLKKAPGLFASLIRNDDQSRLMTCIRLADAMSGSSKAHIKQDFATCAGGALDEDAMRTLDVILMNFGYKYDVPSLLEENSWLLSEGAHDLAMLSGARYIIYLHQLMRTNKWKSFQTWLQEGGADPQEIIEILPLSTITMIMFDIRFQHQGRGVAKFPDTLWANHAAATQLLRTLADINPKPIFDDLDNNDYRMFPRANRSLGRIQDDTESLAAGLLMVDCFLQKTGLEGNCSKVRKLQVHPAVAVRDAMVEHTLDTDDVQFSKKHAAIVSFINFAHFPAVGNKDSRLRFIPKRLPIGSAMVQNPLGLCDNLDCSGFGRMPPRARQPGDEFYTEFRPKSETDGYYGQKLSDRKNESRHIKGLGGPQMYQGQSSSTVGPEMWNSPFMTPSAPPMDDASMGGMSMGGMPMNDSAGFDHPQHMNYASSGFGHSQHVEHPSSMDYRENPQMHSRSYHQAVNHHTAGPSVQYGPVNLSGCKEEYNKCIKVVIKSLLKSRFEEGYVQNAMDRISGWSQENLLEFYDATRASFANSPQNTQGLETWLHEKLQHGSNMDVIYSPSRDTSSGRYPSGGQYPDGNYSEEHYPSGHYPGGHYPDSVNYESTGHFSRPEQRAERERMYPERAEDYEGWIATGRDEYGQAHYDQFGEWKPKKGKQFLHMPPKVDRHQVLLENLSERVYKTMSPEEAKRAVGDLATRSDEELEEILQEANSVQADGIGFRDWLYSKLSGASFISPRGVISWGEEKASGFYDRVGSFLGGVSDYMQSGAKSLAKFADFAHTFGIGDLGLMEMLAGHGQNLLGCVQRLYPSGSSHPGSKDFRTRYLLKFMIRFPSLSLPEFFHPNLSLSELLGRFARFGIEIDGDLWAHLATFLSEEEIANYIDSIDENSNIKEFLAASIQDRLITALKEGRQEEAQAILKTLEQIFYDGPVEIPEFVTLTGEEYSLAAGMSLVQLFDMILLDSKNITRAAYVLKSPQLVGLLFNNLTREELFKLDKQLAESDPEEYRRYIRIALIKRLPLDVSDIRDYILKKVQKELDVSELLDIAIHDFYGRYLMDYILERFDE